MHLKTDRLGIPSFTPDNVVDMIYKGHIDKVYNILCDSSEEFDKFNLAMEELYLPKLSKYTSIEASQEEFDSVCQSEWFMPDTYKDIDLHSFLFDKLPVKDKFTTEYKRMMEELAEFEARGMLNLLKYMIYLVDTMRENNVLWGVGRGSSVGSYVLFLIGVHRIDPIKYNLDWREFLR